SLLSQPSLTVPEIRQLMSQSIRGELTPTSSHLFSHPDMTSSAPMSSMPPLMTALSTLGYAIASQDHSTITNILRDAGAGGKGGAGFLLNQFDYSGNTPLHLAAASDDISIITDFLKRGASVHLRNRDGRTPLFVAAKAGRIRNVRLLTESGAHLHA